jgi:hypothetical protein
MKVAKLFLKRMRLSLVYFSGAHGLGVTNQFGASSSRNFPLAAVCRWDESLMIPEIRSSGFFVLKNCTAKKTEAKREKTKQNKKNAVQTLDGNKKLRNSDVAKKDSKTDTKNVREPISFAVNSARAL